MVGLVAYLSPGCSPSMPVFRVYSALLVFPDDFETYDFFQYIEWCGNWVLIRHSPADLCVLDQAHRHGRGGGWQIMAVGGV